MKRGRSQVEEFEDPSGRHHDPAPKKQATDNASNEPSSGGFVRNAYAELMQNPKQRQLSLAAEAPKLIPASVTINDRQSKFIGHSAPISSRRELDAVVASIAVNSLLKTATHNIRAWRYLNLRPGRSGDSEDDYVVMEGNDDDGEQWASAKLLKLMQVSGACDCVVIVTRWYGGELLGPIRFQHIEAVALSALHAGGFINAPPGLKTPSNAPPNPLFSNDPPTIQPAPEPSQSAPPTAAEVQSQAQRDKLIRLCRARDGTIDSLNHNIQKLHLRLFENQRTIRTLKGTRTDDMSHLNAPEAPSPIKGPPPASEYAAMTDVEVEAKLKERDARIVALKEKLTEWKEKVAEQEKRIEELSFVLAKMGE